MANKIIGEIEFDLDGETVTLSPSFRAIAEIESRLKVGIPELISRISIGDVRISDLITVIWAGMYGKNPIACQSIDDVAKKAQNAGIENLGQHDENGIGVLYKYLIICVAGPKAFDNIEGEKEESGKGKKETKKPG